MQTSYAVEGMTCDHCASAVRRELTERVPGVANVDVDLASGRVTVTSDETLDDAAVQAAIEEAGYALRT